MRIWSEFNSKSWSQKSAEVLFPSVTSFFSLLIRLFTLHVCHLLLHRLMVSHSLSDQLDSAAKWGALQTVRFMERQTAEEQQRRSAPDGQVHGQTSKSTSASVCLFLCLWRLLCSSDTQKDWRTGGRAGSRGWTEEQQRSSVPLNDNKQQ